MLLVFGVGTVSDLLARVEIPIFGNGVTFALPQLHKRGRANIVDTNVRGQMRGGKHGWHKPASDVFSADFECFSREYIEICREYIAGWFVFSADFECFSRKLNE